MNDQNTKTTKSLGKRMCDMLDVTDDLLPGGHRIEIRGRGAISISGCGRILLYAPCEIRVALADSVLSVVGKDLVCVAYSAGEVAIEGRIDNVSFKGECQ